jgi:hypothetical protein
VIGLAKLPLDGNPNNAMGLIAHPKEVSNMVVSHDGMYIFSAGGCDYCVNMWSTNVKALDNSSVKGGTGIEPFVELIDGGRDGPLWKEIEKYFHYAQIKR